VKRVSLDEQVAKTARAWIPYPIGQVDDQLVYVAFYKDGEPQLYGSGNKFHLHDGDQLFLVLTGKVVFHDRAGGQVPAQKGDAVFVARGEFHRASSAEGAHVLHVQSKAVASLFQEEFDRGPEVVAG
jgi:mannose-6-phosphate isomerase-like protein (cupin superfamily)